jgi:hypothetical protein
MNNDFEKLKSEIADAKAAIFGEMETQIQQLEESGDLEKYYDKGVKSAGGRIRKSLQNIRKSVHNPTIRAKMNSIVDSAKNLRETIK